MNASCARREELGKCRSYNQAMQREMHAIRGSASAKITPEQASQMYTLQKIVLGRQTGGYNSGDKPVDEALQVVIEPQDPDGHAIKAPGTLTVQAVEINAEGLKRPLSTWYVTEEQMRRNWRSGLFTTGYFVVLPWQSWPTTDKLRVVAQFTLADGRQFEADKDVTVHLPPQHRAIPTNGSNSPEGIPLPTPTPTPTPRKVEPPMPNVVKPAPHWPDASPVQCLDPVPLSQWRQ